MSRTRSLWSRMGLASTAGDPEEARAFLQRRLALFLALSVALWLLIGVSSELLSRLLLPQLMDTPWRQQALFMHHGGTLVLFVAWLLASRGQRSSLFLEMIDLIASVLQVAMASAAASVIDLQFRPDVSITLGFAYLLIARAAIVPSPPVRTFIIGAVSAISLIASVVKMYWQASAPPVAPGLGISQVATWAGLGIVLTTVISRVIYGLHRRVEAAMRLGQYTLERKIGQGGMGVVHLARHALLRRPTAIKLLRPELSSGSTLARFEREVQLTSTLRHPNTVAIYDYGRTPDGIFYYVMEYLDGATLEELVQQTGPLEQARVIHVLDGVAAALEEAHAAGLVHRDIKPSNVFLSKLGQQLDFVKVLDFGLVKDLEAPFDPAVSNATQIVGTPLYLCPEAIATPDAVNARSDLYAVGAVGYFLLTGRPPFTGRSMLEVCGHILHSPLVLPSDLLGVAIDPALEELVVTCLEKDPARRPASATELLERLRKVGLRRWSRGDAQRFWSDYSGTARTAKVFESGSSGLTNTVAVDFEGRVEGS